MSINTLMLAHNWLKMFVHEGDSCIDATAGRGRDTQLLCELAGESGKVFAFDIQPSALEQTKIRLEEAGYSERAQLILDTHSHMEQYIAPESIQAIVFNFGYLPGGDHQIYTKPESSIAAIEAGLRLLRRGGGMSLSIYYGKDTGYEERDALLAFVKTIDDRQYTVITAEFSNRKNDPPISVWILKE